MIKIGLIACCSQKLSRRLPAGELYCSPLFLKSKIYVEKTCDQWAILSAKHGLVLPSEVIEPYDVTLRDMQKRERVEWGSRVRKQIEIAWPKAEEAQFVILAGFMYRKPLKLRTLPLVNVDIPMQFLTIGKQLQWLDMTNKAFKPKKRASLFT